MHRTVRLSGGVVLDIKGVDAKPGYLSEFHSFKPSEADYQLFASQRERHGTRFGALPLRREGDNLLPWPSPLVRNYGWLLGEGFEQERTVLEVGPGLGRNTFPLLDRGFNVTVVEPERSVRDRIKSFAGSWGIKSRLSFVEGTYQSLAEEMPSVKIDGLVSIGSLQFASTRDVASRFMENVHSRMNQGGVVLLEANNDKDEPNLVSTRERLSDGRDPFYLPSGEELLQIFQRDEWGILYYDPDVKILMPKGDIKLFEDRHPGAKVTQRSKTYIIASKK